MRPAADTSRPTLAERFRAERSTEIIEGDHVVHSVLALPVRGATRLCIRREATHPHRPQALRLAAAVELRVGAHVGTDILLRSTTAPVEVEVLVDAHDATVVYVWNQWTVDGVDHAWLADAGMLVETDLTADPAGVRLRCRDGAGGTGFDDLVVTITAMPQTPTRIQAMATIEPVATLQDAGA